MKLAKTITLLALVFLMVLGCSTAFAAADFSKWEQQACPFQEPDGSYNHNNWKTIVTVNIDTASTISANVYLGDTLFSQMHINGSADASVQVDAGQLSLEWCGVDTKGWHPGPDAGNQIFTIIITDDAGNQIGAYDFTYSFAHTIYQHQPVVQGAWMSMNTVCSFGPHFKDYTDITNQWYMFSVVDLTIQGTQTFELVAGGMYKVGNAYVTVDGDNLTVDYEYFKSRGITQVYDKGEFFTIFDDLANVTTVNPDELESMVYGQTYSIANDLGGDTTVLLYMCNKATYRNDSPAVQRFYENLPWRVKVREAMLEMIDLVPVK